MVAHTDYKPDTVLGQQSTIHALNTNGLSMGLLLWLYKTLIFPLKLLKYASIQASVLQITN